MPKKDRSEYHREYARKNRARIAEKLRKWRAANREKNNAYARKYYHEDPAKFKAWQQRWRALKNEAYKAQIRRAGAKRKERVQAVPKCDPKGLNILRQLIASAARLACGICGRNMPRNDRSIDHIIPFGKGGTNDIANLRVVHRSCNSRKCDRLPVDLDGQHEMNFAGNGAYPNKIAGETLLSMSRTEVKDATWISNSKHLFKHTDN